MSVASYGVVNSPCTQAISTEVVEAGDESFFTDEPRFTPKVSVIKRILNPYVVYIG